MAYTTRPLQRVQPSIPLRKLNHAIKLHEICQFGQFIIKRKNFTTVVTKCYNAPNSISEGALAQTPLG